MQLLVSKPKVELSRRRLLTGLVCLVAAPAIVRAASIMPVKMVPTNLIGIGAIGGGLSREHNMINFYTRLRLYFGGLKADGLWDQLDVIHVFDAPTEELACTNWKTTPL